MNALAKVCDAKAVHGSRVQRGRPMSRCEPPGPESPHRCVTAAAPVCCGAERTHPA